MKRAVTIVEVARRAGVSVGTVSNVLNGSAAVSEAKRIRITEAIGALGFSRSMIATGMRTQRSRTIGLCLPFTNYENFTAIADALERVVSAAGYELMQVYSRQEPETELRRVERLLAHKVGGVLLLPSMQPKASLDAVDHAGVPTVLVNRPTGDARFDEVMVDHRGAAFAVAKELVARGHRRIMLASQYPALAVTQLRLAAIEEASAGSKVRTALLDVGKGDAFAAALGTSGGAKGAIICSNSLIAGAAIRAIRAAGLRCPDDVSLVSLDAPDWADLVTPQLSVVRQPSDRLALAAWELLARRMADEQSPRERKLIPAEIAFSDSVAAGAKKRKGAG